MSIWKDKRFILYFFLLYLGNLAAISASNTIFLASTSLDLLGANKTFIAFFIGIPRYMVIILTFINLFVISKPLNRTLLIQLGSLSGIIAFTGVSFGDGYISLIAFCALYGFSYMVALTYITSMILDYVPMNQRLSVLGLFTTSASLGSFFGPYLSRILFNTLVAPYDGIFPSLYIFDMFSVSTIHTGTNPNIMFLSGILFYIVVGITLTSAQFISKSMTPVVSSSKIKQKTSRAGFFKNYRGLISLSLILGGIWMTFMTFLPSLDHTLKTGYITWYFSGYSLVALFGRLLIAPKLSTWKASFIIKLSYRSYFLAFLLVIYFAIYPQIWTLCLIGCMQGFSHGIMFPAMNVFFTQKTPENTTRATNAFTLIFQLGCLCVIPLGGLVDLFGYLPMFILAFIIFCGMYIFAMSHLFIQELDEKEDSQ